MATTARSVNWEEYSRSHSATTFECGWCSRHVATKQGWRAHIEDVQFIKHQVSVPVCTNCGFPSILSSSPQLPMKKPGRSIDGVPADVNVIHEEARASLSVGAFHGVAMLCRKILMHVAVEKGDAEGKKFIQYVEFLVAGYMPPTAKAWIDRIRTVGNDVTHAIDPITESAATDLLKFTETLLELVYELPERMKTTP